MSKALWTSSDAANATEGHVAADWSAVGVSIDTRTIDLGDLFVALVGDNSDGHAHVKDALAKGAAAAMVAHRCDGVSDEGLLIVEDTMAGLQALGRAARARTGRQDRCCHRECGQDQYERRPARNIGSPGSDAWIRCFLQ